MSRRLTLPAYRSVELHARREERVHGGSVVPRTDRWAPVGGGDDRIGYLPDRTKGPSTSSAASCDILEIHHAEDRISDDSSDGGKERTCRVC